MRANPGRGARHKQLLLVGTVHRDPAGVPRLTRLLAREEPAAVAVEVSPYALFYRRRNGKVLRRRLRRWLRRLATAQGVCWRGHGQLDAIEAQLQLPFEYRGAQRYCRDAVAQLLCLDCSWWSRYWIHSEWGQLLSRSNLAELLERRPESLSQEVRGAYQLAARLLSEPGRCLVPAFVRSWSADPRYQQREIELARRVELGFARLSHGRLVYVGGWQHLLSPTGIGSVFERLSHLRPRRILLWDGVAEPSRS